MVAFVIAAIVAPALGTLDQAFQFIQEYTGFVSPGVLAIFFFGVFWKKATSNAALTAAVLTIPLSTALKFGMPNLPFLDRMGIVFLICLVGMYFISMNDIRKGVQTNGLEVDRSMFKLHPAFVVGVLILFGIIAALYTILW